MKDAADTSLPEPITALIHAAARGDEASRERLLAALYADLRRLAAAKLARAPTCTDLDARALVHEAYLRLADHIPPEAASRRVFFEYAARAMRSVVVDHVRRRRAAKRERSEVTLGTGSEGEPEAWSDERVEALHDAMARLERIDGELHAIVGLRVYGGLTVEETAALLTLSPATIKRRWTQAMTILRAMVEGR